MGIGRIAALLGSLSPSAAEQAQSDVTRTEPAIAEAASNSSDHNFQDNPSSDAAIQIQAVIGAIRQLNENAGQDGAAMAFSQSGGTLKESVGGLTYLMQNARDSRAALPAQMLSDVAQVARDVEARVQTVRDGIDQRLTRMQGADQQRLRQAADSFVAEMQNTLTTLKTLAGG